MVVGSNYNPTYANRVDRKIQTAMSERFDTLFSGMSEESAIKILQTNTKELDNPGTKYLAATRLGACSSAQSFQLLIETASNTSEELYERITRRKALDALGRRKSPQAIPVLLEAMDSEDEPTVVNASDALARIGSQLSEAQQDRMLKALDGPDNQRRAVIQALTRLGLKDRNNAILNCQLDPNPLVAGAALAHAVRIDGKLDALQPLISQLQDDNPGRRRAAVIDLGDAGQEQALAPLLRCPVSMPLRAKSAFQMTGTDRTSISEENCNMLDCLLQDDPRSLDLPDHMLTAPEPEAIKNGLQHRDEARQYAAACALMKMPTDQQVSLIHELRNAYGSDYGVHYLLASCSGLLQLHAQADLVRDALSEEAPQYAKSRVAAAWSCLRLRLKDQRELILKIGASSRWEPLRWSCVRVLEAWA